MLVLGYVPKLSCSLCHCILLILRHHDGHELQEQVDVNPANTTDTTVESFLWNIDHVYASDTDSGNPQVLIRLEYSPRDRRPLRALRLCWRDLPWDQQYLPVPLPLSVCILP
jgi:hypothetical protein